MAAPVQQYVSAQPAAPQQQSAEGKVLVGTVKTFIPDKGYGFITTPDLSGDIYFKGDGELVLDKGAQVCFILQFATDGKARANSVQLAIAKGEQLVGSIVSFNSQKGFGFFAVPDRLQDVYFKAENLPAELQDTSNLIGAEVQFTTELTSSGKPQMRDAEFVSGPTGTAPPRLAQTKRPASGMVGNMAASNDANKRQRTLPPPPAPLPPAAFAGHVAQSAPAHNQAPQNSRCFGTVKRYDVAKGFGFISSTFASSDVFFQKSQLPVEYQSNDVTGLEVSFNLRYTADGKPQGGSLQVNS